MRIRLKELLEEKNMTVSELAKKAGYRKVQIQSICDNDKKSVNKECLEKIAEVLKVRDIRKLIEL